MTRVERVVAARPRRSGTCERPSGRSRTPRSERAARPGPGSGAGTTLDRADRGSRGGGQPADSAAHGRDGPRRGRPSSRIAAPEERVQLTVERVQLVVSCSSPCPAPRALDRPHGSTPSPQRERSPAPNASPAWATRGAGHRARRPSPAPRRRFACHLPPRASARARRRPGPAAPHDHGPTARSHRRRHGRPGSESPSASGRAGARAHPDRAQECARPRDTGARPARRLPGASVAAAAARSSSAPELPPEPVERRSLQSSSNPRAEARRRDTATARGRSSRRARRPLRQTTRVLPSRRQASPGLPYARPRDVDVGVVGPGGNRRPLRYTEGVGGSTGQSAGDRERIDGVRKGNRRRPVRRAVVGRGDRIHRRHAREP